MEAAGLGGGMVVAVMVVVGLRAAGVTVAAELAVEV